MNGKKLRLNKETIRNLSDENLEQVAGGKRKDGNTAIIGCSGVCNSVLCSDPKFSGCIVVSCVSCVCV
jgi:hypothetical protein